MGIENSKAEISPEPGAKASAQADHLTLVPPDDYFDVSAGGELALPEEQLFGLGRKGKAAWEASKQLVGEIVQSPFGYELRRYRWVDVSGAVSGLADGVKGKYGDLKETLAELKPNKEGEQ